MSSAHASLVSHEDLPDRYTSSRARVTTRKLSEHLSAQVDGVDLSEPVSTEAFFDIQQAWVTNGVLTFREQRLSPTMHVDFSSRFGKLIGHVVNRFSLPDYPQVTVLSNIEDDKGQKIGADRAGMIWHSDLSFMQCPSLGSFLYGVECPPEGVDTEFSSTRAAYEALPEDLAQRLADLHGVHDYA